MKKRLTGGNLRRLSPIIITTIALITYQIKFHEDIFSRLCNFILLPGMIHGLLAIRLATHKSAGSFASSAHPNCCPVGFFRFYAVKR